MDGLPLSGLRVVSIEHAVAGPLCTRHLADLGASVTKVEHPEHGDLARHYDSTAGGTSAYFAWLNYGKDTVALNLKERQDRRAFDGLLRSADVFVTNLSPPAVDRLEVDYSSVVVNDDIIHCQISGYPKGHPREDDAAFDLLIQANSGLVSLTGSQNSPAKVGISVVDISAGMYALTSILAALHLPPAARSPIRIAMTDAIREWLGAPILWARGNQRSPERAGRYHNMIAPYGPLPTRDASRDVYIAVQTETQWKALCDQVLQAPGIESRGEFGSNADRLANSQMLYDELSSASSRLQASTLLARAQRVGVPATLARDVLEVATCHENGAWLAAMYDSNEVLVPRGPLWAAFRDGNDEDLSIPSHGDR